MATTADPHITIDLTIEELKAFIDDVETIFEPTDDAPKKSRECFELLVNSLMAYEISEETEFRLGPPEPKHMKQT